MLLAQLLLRPIHVIRSGLTRLGRGEFGVRLDLDQHDEFGELGTFFNTVSAQLSADRSQMAGQVANLESAVEHLEDAVAIVNPTRRAAVREPRDARAAAGRGGRRVARTTLVAGRSSAAAAVRADARRAGSRAGRCRRRSVRRRAGERLILTPPDQRSEGRAGRHHADRAQPRVPEPGAVDDALLAEARGARPAVGRRGARGEESAERDDDSPRAAAAAVRRARAGAGAASRPAAPAAAVATADGAAGRSTDGARSTST